MRANACGNGFTTLDLRVLHVDGADAELLVPQQPLEMRRHVVLDQKGGARNFADQISLIAANIEIAVADLRVVFLADSVIALTDMDRNMDGGGEPFNGGIDGLDRTPDFIILRHREIWLIDLNVPAARLSEHLEIVPEKLGNISYHPSKIVIVLVIGDLCQEIRPSHCDLDGLLRER